MFPLSCISISSEIHCTSAGCRQKIPLVEDGTSTQLIAESVVIVAIKPKFALPLRAKQARANKNLGKFFW